MPRVLYSTDKTQDADKAAPAGAAGVRGRLTQRERPAQKGARAACGVFCGIALWLIGPERTSLPARATSDWLIP